ncbi:Mannose-P-dolichol utilization defect 1 protein-like protein [Aphelenchoides besseyi]|nr:Mannose-P-dolichol utilization defect 1 protein-like protein [Aphelenchoides besseyi]KAI6226971.1 Mannose-P-dolichol utilization defect 1 protein-like protein [Aphelenchoides besseyi]
MKYNVDWAIKQIFPGNCWNRMIVDADFLNQECLRAVVSRLLGFGITAGSAFLLLPQILKIHNARSGQGISLAAQLLALLGAGAICAYSYEKQFVFSQWGDSLLVFIQTTMIVMQILYYSPYTSYTFAFMAFIWMLSTAVAYHVVPFYMIQALQTAVIPITIASKGIQISTNFRNKSTGQLAFISVLLQFGGCVARIFTSVQETGDTLVIFTYVFAALLNGVIFLQMLYY